jgi:hypothetical protein
MVELPRPRDVNGVADYLIGGYFGVKILLRNLGARANIKAWITVFPCSMFLKLFPMFLSVFLAHGKRHGGTWKERGRDHGN